MVLYYHKTIAIANEKKSGPDVFTPEPDLIRI